MKIKKNVEKFFTINGHYIWQYLYKRKALLPNGTELNIDIKALNNIDPNYGDWLIHPCVRYIKDGFASHKWWMVVTPYPNFNDKYENPLLYYGEGNNDVPPQNWHLVGVVQGSHQHGYNADCNLFYDKEKLWIFWKESETINTKPEYGNKAILGCSYDGKHFSRARVFANNPDSQSMYLCAPVIHYVQNQIVCHAVYIPRGKDLSTKECTYRGLSKFQIESLEKGQFLLEKVYDIKYPKGFDYWHIDFFEYKNIHYSVVTPEVADRILLGISKDGDNYDYYRTPLLSWSSNRLSYMYKSSACVVNGIFYLFYPKRINGNTVRIYETHIEFDKLIKLINK